MQRNLHALFNACLVFIALAPTAARAEITYSDVPGDLSSTVIKMTVTPAAEPVPAFAHRFVSQDIDLKPGNAAPYYYRALLDLPRRMDAVRKKYKGDEELDKWNRTDGEATPLDKLPLTKVRDAVESTIGGGVEDQLKEASQRRDCDFELGISEVRGVELIYILLEEFQRSREISRMLALRTRLEIAEHRYDDAISTMRMNYRLAHDFGSLPFIVSGLIGIAEAGITNGTALELIAQPGSPNLYWAFSELPDPLINMRNAIRFEMDFGPRMFPFIHNAITTDRSADEWNRLFARTFVDLQKAGADLSWGNGPSFESDDVPAGIVATGIALLGYPHAKSQLIAQGMDRKKVEKMAVGQVMAIYTEQHYQRLADDFEKIWYMPYQESRARNEEIERELGGANLLSGSANRELVPMVSLMMPAMQAARSADIRLQRELASLRVIEALRMYAASHEGKLPPSLNDIKQVPVPLNPATGKEFLYHLDGATGILELPPSDGISGSNRRFEIQIANK
jgi:hypothetical protein